MHQDAVKEIFDQMAPVYDSQWAKTAPMQTCLYYLLDAYFAGLPQKARILCVGAGTGKEISHFARSHPGWQFTAVEPSGAMLDICRQRAEDEGYAERCSFHEGYLSSLPAGDPHDAALSILVSQFVVEPTARSEFFREISRNLKPGGLLASADLASDVNSPEYEVLLRGWMKMLAAADVTPEGLERMRQAYRRDVAVIPPDQVADIIRSAGFERPTQFFQAGLIHAWISRNGS
ncbi:MAG TPA: class I SAM-dependent methyltransferase [Burkholderiaceae bacterium]|nr:class I SAM-dependent methyltransferase [Burkholderiaceae bacterium]